jgi:hypothetical protein
MFRACRNATRPSASSFHKAKYGFAQRAASGHAAAPPNSVINARRFIQ